MATVYKLLKNRDDFYVELQINVELANDHRHQRFLAAVTIQRYTRGYLIRKHFAWLAYNAIIIQCAFRSFLARKAYRAALRRAVKRAHYRYYYIAARRIQALWRGHVSRRYKFCYRSYRRWLRTVTERGERRAAEAAEYSIRSRADDLRILEEEARQWLAFVVFKLHHLLRTYVCAGIYSDPATAELSEFEKLLQSIHYTEYMKRLKRKYDEFVRKHRPLFSNKRLFPIIGEGTDYWYLSLPEMYEITTPGSLKKKSTRHMATHHGPIHKQPFLWKKVRPPCATEGRGPFKSGKEEASMVAPPPTPVHTNSGDGHVHKDPRFNLYVKHYKPQPDLFDYVDFHINILLTRKCSVENIHRK